MNELISTLTNYLTSIQNFIWGPPMIVLLLGLGLLLTVNLKLLQLRKLSLALRMQSMNCQSESR